MMSRLFGANWQTTLWGSITAIAMAIAATPSLIGFLPDSIEATVRGIAGIIAAGSGIKFALESKSRNVTGGLVQQTSYGEVASRLSQEGSSAVMETRQSAPKP